MRFNRYGTGANLDSPSLQALLMRELSVAQLRNLSPLPEDSQKIIDQAVIRVGLDRLVIVQDLLAEGLTFPLADAMSVMELQWDSISKAGGAQRSMNPSARGENQLPDRTPNRIPIYLTWDDFNLGIRTLRASERVGAPLDTTLVEESTRRVNEGIEDAAINGCDIQTSGLYSAPGLLNAPNVNEFAYAGAEAWDAAGHTGEEILQDVLGMIDMAHAARRFGPYNLYIPTTYGTKLQEDFKSNGTITIQQRLEQITAGGRNIRIRVADQLPTNRTALVQMTRDVVDVVTGQSPVVIPWTTPGGFNSHWLVLAIIVPRVKTDYAGKSGIVIGDLT